MPTVEGLQFAYALHPLAPGRLPFRRWRWELWHGTTLVAAGWRLSRPQAARALRTHAAEYGHKLFGLRPPAREDGAQSPPRDIVPGAAERVVAGAITCLLVPRALDAPAMTPLALQ